MFSRMILGTCGVLDILLLGAAISGSTLAFSQEEQTQQSLVQGQQTVKEPDSKTGRYRESIIPGRPVKEDSRQNKFGFHRGCPSSNRKSRLRGWSHSGPGLHFPAQQARQSVPSFRDWSGRLNNRQRQPWHQCGRQLFMKENRFQVQGIFANGNVNYTLFGEVFCAINAIAVKRWLGAESFLSSTG